jgi:hypothetical protein
VLVGGEEENASANLLALCKVGKHFSHQLKKIYVLNRTCLFSIYSNY